MKRYRKVCEKCGSEDLHFDASVYWSSSTQRYEIDDVWDTYCRDCEDTTYAEDRQIFEINKNVKIL